jgi:hypothetical protein
MPTAGLPNESFPADIAGASLQKWLSGFVSSRASPAVYRLRKSPWPIIFQVDRTAAFIRLSTVRKDIRADDLEDETVLETMILGYRVTDQLQISVDKCSKRI